MENRRQTYRHPFVSADALRVQLGTPEEQATLACDLLDLSLGGMRVRLHDPVGALKRDDRIIARLLGRQGPAPVELGLALLSSVAYVERRDDAVCCGVHFLPAANPAINDNVEKTLGRFLMAEQRRMLRRT